jgi:hypothetical protein
MPSICGLLIRTASGSDPGLNPLGQKRSGLEAQFLASPEGVRRIIRFDSIGATAYVALSLADESSGGFYFLWTKYPVDAALSPVVLAGRHRLGCWLLLSQRSPEILR